MKYLAQISQPIENPALPKINTKSGLVFFQDLIPALVTLGFVIGSLVFFFFLISGAITWIVSGGDKAKLESARSRITNAIIGFAVLILAFAVVNLLETFFAIDIALLDIGAIMIR